MISSVLPQLLIALLDLHAASGGLAAYDEGFPAGLTLILVEITPHPMTIMEETPISTCQKQTSVYKFI